MFFSGEPRNDLENIKSKTGISRFRLPKIHFWFLLVNFGHASTSRGFPVTGFRVADGAEGRDWQSCPGKITLSWARISNSKYFEFELDFVLRISRFPPDHLRTSRGSFSAVSTQASKYARSFSKKKRNPGIRAQLNTPILESKYSLEWRIFRHSLESSWRDLQDLLTYSYTA